MFLHARLFFTGQLWNPWQMLVKPLGSMELWLKITALGLEKSTDTAQL